MTFRSFRFTSKNNKKRTKISLKTSPNPLKIEPGLLPKRHSKKQQEKAPQNRQKVEICSPTGSLGGGSSKSVFESFSSPDDPWNQNGPKTPPKSLRDPPGRHFFMISGQFWTPFLVVVVALWVCFLWALWNEEQRTKNKERSRHGGGDGPQGNWIL